LIPALVRRSVNEALADGAARAVLVFLAGFALAAPAVSGAGIAAGSRVVGDLGLAGAGLLTAAAGVALGIRQVGGEIRSRRTVAVLARPVPLGVWVGSRLVGVALVLAGIVATAGGGAALIAAWWGDAPTPDDAAFALLAWARAVAVTAAAMAASALARPALAALAASVLWGASFVAGDAAEILGAPALAWAVPSLGGSLLLAVFHALAWAAVYAAIATWGVGRTDRG